MESISPSSERYREKYEFKNTDSNVNEKKVAEDSVNDDETKDNTQEIQSHEIVKNNLEQHGVNSGFYPYRKKLNAIQEYLEEHSNHKVTEQILQELRSFALSEGGLINDDIRSKVWPMLLQLDRDDYEPPPTLEQYQQHKEYYQVVLDVNRSLRRFPPGIPLQQRLAMQDQLIRLILRVIMKHPQLQYYQGYHDVAVTFLLVVGEDVSFHIMEKLSTDHLKHFMEPTMESTSQLLNYIFPLLERVHPQLCEYIERAEVGTMFCLPWFLTWYSHTLTRYEHVVRLYDYFVASPPLLPLYLIVAIVVHRQEEIFNTECELAMQHQLLSQLPDDLPFEMLLKKASELYELYPPESIENAIEEKNMKKLKLSIDRKSKVNRDVKVRNGIPNWMLPYGRFKYILVSASFAVGLYAYLRYANNFDIYSTISK